VQRDDFEQMTARDIRVHARDEGGVQRGKPLYFERPWQEILDEMEGAGVRTVGELTAARVRTLYEAVSGL
jgi:hypothetical protein